MPLAQGLTRAGADVTVYERDAALDSRGQGYRIHLHAAAALEACLPPDLYELCFATAGQRSTQVTVVTSGLRVLRRTDVNPASLATSVNRQTFREILAARLEGVIEFGRPCVGFTQDADSVRARFADGTEAGADVLVAADGVGSPIRRQYLPQLAVENTGSICTTAAPDSPSRPDRSCPRRCGMGSPPSSGACPGWRPGCWISGRRRRRLPGASHPTCDSARWRRI